MPLPNSKLRFRSRGGLLIPFISVTFPLQAVKAIHVGPMRDQDLAHTSMKALVSMVMSNFPTEDDATVPDIDVVMSKIPFRASS